MRVFYTRVTRATSVVATTAIDRLPRAAQHRVASMQDRNAQAQTVAGLLLLRHALAYEAAWQRLGRSATGGAFSGLARSGTGGLARSGTGRSARQGGHAAEGESLLSQEEKHDQPTPRRI